MTSRQHLTEQKECEGGEDSDEDDSKPYSLLGLMEHGKPVSHTIPEAPDVEWKGRLIHGHLYIHVTKGQLAAGSRECLVSLIDEAEAWGCGYVIIFFSKSTTSSNNKETSLILQTFKMVGFELLKPSMSLLPQTPLADGFHFMAYQISE